MKQILLKAQGIFKVSAQGKAVQVRQLKPLLPATPAGLIYRY